MNYDSSDIVTQTEQIEDILSSFCSAEKEKINRLDASIDRICAKGTRLHTVSLEKLNTYGPEFDLNKMRTQLLNMPNL